MKLLKLKYIAHNELRETMWTPVVSGTYPFEHVRPKDIIVIDLISGISSPDREGDNVEKYYKATSKWFHEVVEKEEIPTKVIESATRTIKL